MPDPKLEEVMIWASQICDDLKMIESELLTKGDLRADYFWITLQEMSDYSRSLSEAIRKALSNE